LVIETILHYDIRSEKHQTVNIIISDVLNNKYSLLAVHVGGLLDYHQGHMLKRKLLIT